MLELGMRQMCALVTGVSQLWSLLPGLGISRTGGSVSTGGHCGTPSGPTLAAGTPEAPPRQTSKGPSHGWRACGAAVLAARCSSRGSHITVGVVQHDAGMGALTEFGQSAPAMNKEPGKNQCKRLTRG